MERIVLFDGVCNFCNGAVNWIIGHDPHGAFRFAPLQSEIGERLTRQYAVPENIDSIVLIEDGRAFTHSSAGLRIARGLGGIWKAGYAGILIPRPIRDALYRWFASNRYRWFGKQDACMIPTPEVRSRFLSEPTGIVAVKEAAGALIYLTRPGE